MEFLIGVLFLAVVIAISLFTAHRRRKSWEAFARERGLNYLDRGWMAHPVVTGTHLDHPVTLDIEVRGSGKSKAIFTRFVVPFACGLPPGMTITAEGFSDKLSKLFGGQDIEVGLPALDKALRIKGVHEAPIVDLLRRDKVGYTIKDLLLSYPLSVVTSEQVKVLKRGFDSNHGRLGEMMDDLLGVVTLVEGAWGQRAPKAEKAEARPAEEALSPVSPPFRAPQATLPQESPDDAPPAALVAPGPAQGPLERLAGLSGRERQEFVSQLTGQALGGVMEVDHVTLTTELGLGPEYRSGRTVVGRFEGGVAVTLRLPEGLNEEVRSLPRGARVEVRGVVVGWDGFYERVMMEGDEKDPLTPRPAHAS